MARNIYLKRIKRDIVYILIRVIVGFFRIIPRRAALGIGSLFGKIAPYIARKDFRIAIENLTLAFGGEKDQKEIRHLAYETFRNTALNFVDTVRLGAMNPEDIKQVSVTHNIEHLLEVLKKGRGVIALTAHVGCWELTGAYLTTSGVPVSAIAARLYDPRLEDMLVTSRQSAGLKNISRGRDTRDIIRALKNGDMLAILIDQDINVRGVFVDFFGRPAHTAVAPAQLALKYKKSIVPIFSYRDKEHRIHHCFFEPLKIEPSGDREKDIAEITAQCSRATEDFIREHPEQWVWFHSRWKSKPETIWKT